MTFNKLRLVFTDQEGKTTVYTVGDVLRSRAAHAFSDEVILGFGVGDSGAVFVRVARPYAYAHCVGTGSPVPLLGCEEYSFHVCKLHTYKVVDNRTLSTNRNIPDSETLTFDLQNPLLRPEHRG